MSAGDYYYRQSDPTAKHAYEGSSSRCRICDFTANHVLHMTDVPDQIIAEENMILAEQCVNVFDRILDTMCEQHVDGFIVGFSQDRHRMMFVYGDNCYIIPTYSLNGLGRWECSKAHFNHNSALYRGRYPIAIDSPDFKDAQDRHPANISNDQSTNGKDA